MMTAPPTIRSAKRPFRQEEAISRIPMKIGQKIQHTKTRMKSRNPSKIIRENNTLRAQPRLF